MIILVSLSFTLSNQTNINKKLAYASTNSSNSVTLVSHGISSMLGGGELYTYTLSDGRELKVPIPPKGFSPLNATADQLAEYDFPPRPASRTDLTDWEQSMASYKSTSIPSSTTAAFDFARLSQPIHGHYVTMSTSTAASGNWGGYSAIGGSPGAASYVAVKDEVVVPSIGYSSSCSSIYGVPIMDGSWVGLGGWQTGSLIQEGLGWCGGNYLSSNPGWEMFGEALNSSNQNAPGPLCAVTTFQSPGDQLYMNMSYQNSTQTAYFYIDNITTGVVTNCSLGIINSYYDGSTADWINEQPRGSLGTPPNNYTCINALANYSSFNINDAYTELNSNGSWVSLGSQTNNQKWFSI